jgi:hypothetical protein
MATQSAVLPSTFVLTLLLAIGLFFFIRASVKDRIETAQLVSDCSDDTLREQLRQYFTQRAYRVVQIDPEQSQVIFEGSVAPSWFLAVFLSVLAGLGLFCLGLVVVMTLNYSTGLALVPVMLAPLAGWFYWSKAGRSEQIVLKIGDWQPTDGIAAEAGEGQTGGQTEGDRSLLTVIGHRDELADLQRILQLKSVV